MSFYLAIVSPLDAPLFELSFQSSRPSQPPSNNTSTSSFPSWSTFTGSNGSDLGLSAPPTPVQSSNANVAGAPAVGTGFGARNEDGSGGEGKLGGNLGLIMQQSQAGPSKNAMSGGGVGGMERHMCQMIAHKSLDSIEETMETSGQL